MARRFSWLALLVILVVSAAPMRASSVPAPIQGTVAGIELCEEATCGAAIFVTGFAGQVGGHFAIGTILVSVVHELPLPGPNLSVNILGGAWRLTLLNGQTMSGILAHGTLLNNNGNGTFHVNVPMVITSGGVGGATFDGTLSHNTFPPTISGHITP
jgi:hypothetical protein